MSREAIHSDGAPDAIGPYSQAVRDGKLLFVSGQIPLDPSTGEPIDGDITAQTHRVMKNLEAILRAAGAGFDQVMRTTIYVTDLSHFATVNTAYGTYFTDPAPARATVQVAALPKDVQVEIDAIAVLS